VRIDHSGIHKEKFIGTEPSGAKFSFKGIHILQISNDGLINLWAVEDMLGFMQQLGMLLKMKEVNK
jgi:predicted ester cyclase